MKKRGFALVVSLLLLLVVFVLGIGFLGKRIALYKEALSSRSAGQARMAALAGMEDVRVKLEKDVSFPPLGSADQEVFSYSENLLDVSGNTVGGYKVTVDKRLQRFPYAVVRLTSVGWSGSSASPTAQRRIYAELDVSSLERGTSNPNPNFFHLINWLDSGSY